MSETPPSSDPRGGTQGSSTSVARGFDRKRTIALASIIVIIGAVLALVLTRGSTKNSPPASAVKQPATSHGTGYFASFAPNICPLTDTVAPGGKAPLRPALAVKIGNEPLGARPQSGLNAADIVYDTPAEGGVMRYVAVFQCNNATAIGPTRSVRYVDWHIIRQFIHPIFAYANGIIPDVNVVDASKWISSADLLTNAASATYRTTDRQAPDNLYTSSAGLYALFPSSITPPPPVFRYSTATPSRAKPISRVQINFSFDTNVVWTWTGSDWSHGYANGTVVSPDVDSLSHTQVTTDNVVIEIVNYRFGRWPESPGSTGDVESQTRGSGPGYILRNGTMTPVTWHRRSLINPDTFTDARGQAVALAPGRTWVEILLNSTAKNPGALTFTP
ncbi:MAG TPA: DUF3048 domain-containing protein [Acidimicrobiales bacterium]|nr:DUF3048 domain-containing protein [Acidimicrobiales bacterium]